MSFRTAKARQGSPLDYQLSSRKAQQSNEQQIDSVWYRFHRASHLDLLLDEDDASPIGRIPDTIPGRHSVDVAILAGLPSVTWRHVILITR
jgi:hypothetical protein